MRPFRSFLILLIFLACFTGLSYIFPNSNLFPPVREFIPDRLLAHFQEHTVLNPLPGVIDEDPLESDTVKIPAPDSLLMYAKPFTPADSLKNDSSLVHSIDSITPVESDPLTPFIDSLTSSKGQIRVMYYGDSQIEGDRITYYLRNFLRLKKGGSGPGLFLPVMPVMYTRVIKLRSSSNWMRYNYLSSQNKEISHRNLGPFMTICRYLPEGEIREVPEKAFVRITPSSTADTASSQYEYLRIFYGNTPENISIKISGDGEKLYEGYLVAGKIFTELECKLDKKKDILIEFEGTESPDIYGISIESKQGIIVDNIPQRGSAGLEFTMVNRNNLKESLRILHPDLIILHYGLNVVKNVKADYSFYRKGLTRQLQLIRELAPQTPLMLVGVTDMASREGDSLRSYSNIPYIIEAQEAAASGTGTAFWNSYKAMGGKESIITWANKQIPLAQKDYVHFTFEGSDSISKLLVNEMFTIKSNDIIANIAYKADVDTITDDSIKTIDTPAVITIPVENQSGIMKATFNQIFSYDSSKPLIFSSAAFWIFLLFVLAGYSLVYKKLVLRNFYLFILSLFFYYKSGGVFLFLLILVTVVDFSCGLLISRSEKKFSRKFFILFSIISNLGILAYFKYTHFFITAINGLLGTDFQLYDYLASFSNQYLGSSFDINNIILPVGISFFTFQSLSYTIDVYRRKVEPVRNILDFGFYVSFFPQLVAGPIVRASEFIPQLYNKFHLDKREFSQALFLISKGLIKKIVISDFIAVNFIDRVFEMPSVYSGFENLMAIYGYGLQIYCDFSGYTDIAIGVALILGFRLPINFNSPYKATDPSDFWKRWHISLSRWLKDYLYIPLGGNKKGWLRTNFNLLITMLLGGLWHGASLRFIIWGGLHGAGLVINKIFNNIFGNRFKSGWFTKTIAVFITFQFVSFCWIFFRADTLNDVTVMIKQIFENFSPGSYMTVIPAYSNVFILIAIGYIIHFLPEKTKESYRGLFIKIPVPAQLATVMVIAIMLYQMRSTEVVPFIYFRF